MPLTQIEICADESLVESYPDGFVMQFRWQCCCVAGPYSRLIGRKIRNFPHWNLFILLFENSKEALDPNDGSVVLKRNFPFAEYRRANDYGKKYLISQLILSIAKEPPFTKDEYIIFENIHKKLVSLNFIYTHRTAYKYIDKDTSVRLYCQLELDKYTLGAEIRRKGYGALERIFISDLISTGEWCYRFSPVWKVLDKNVRITISSRQSFQLEIN